MEIDRMTEQLQRTPDLEGGGDVGDRAAHDVGQDVSAQTIEQLGQMLQQANEALIRHQDGEYGLCQSCGREIPIERLRALPFALYCRECQERNEAPNPGNPPRL
jgi:DnaK suppressor protein